MAAELGQQRGLVVVEPVAPVISVQPKRSPARSARVERCPQLVADTRRPQQFAEPRAEVRAAVRRVPQHPHWPVAASEIRPLVHVVDLILMAGQLHGHRRAVREVLRPRAGE